MNTRAETGLILRGDIKDILKVLEKTEKYAFKFNVEVIQGRTEQLNQEYLDKYPVIA